MPLMSISGLFQRAGNTDGRAESGVAFKDPAGQKALEMQALDGRPGNLQAHRHLFGRGGKEMHLKVNLAVGLGASERW